MPISLFEVVLMNPSFAGLIGCVLSLLIRIKDNQKLSDKLFTIIGGMSCVWYISPFLAEWMQIHSVTGKPFLGLVLGFLGIDVLVKGREWFKNANFVEIFEVIKKGGL